MAVRLLCPAPSPTAPMAPPLRGLASWAVVGCAVGLRKSVRGPWHTSLGHGNCLSTNTGIPLPYSHSNYNHNPSLTLTLTLTLFPNPTRNPYLNANPNPNPNPYPYPYPYP